MCVGMSVCEMVCVCACGCIKCICERDLFVFAFHFAATPLRNSIVNIISLCLYGFCHIVIFKVQNTVYF